MRHLLPAIVFLVCGSLALAFPAGWAPTPTWLFCLGVGLVSLYQGLLLMRLAQKKRPVEEGQELRSPMVSSEGLSDETPSSRRRSSEDELLNGFGVQIDDSPSDKP